MLSKVVLTLSLVILLLAVVSVWARDLGEFEFWVILCLSAIGNIISVVADRLGEIKSVLEKK